VAATKRFLRIIEVDQVERIFDTSSINDLARIAKLPSYADKEHFANGIREAARIYAKDAREPTANELNKQITELHRAAEHLRYERVASLIESLSPKAQDMLNERAERWRPPNKLPPPEALRDHGLRETACATVAGLCRIGGKEVEGRLRPSGRRSRSWEWALYAPLLSRNFPKRQSELDFVMHLQLAWLEAVGKKPPRSANANRLGPFGRMVKACLERVGAGSSDASVAGHINELNRRRRVIGCR
jgi:hypothetical protein